MLLALVSVVIPRSESRGVSDHILLSQIRDSPNLEGQAPVFISPRNRVAQLYSQALGSLFVASYESQGYCGGIQTHLHAGCCRLYLRSRNKNSELTQQRTPTTTVLLFLSIWLLCKRLSRAVP
jgi:hypothetical protein